jgi:hypothetical protein
MKKSPANAGFFFGVGDGSAAKSSTFPTFFPHGSGVLLVYGEQRANAGIAGRA